MEILQFIAELILLAVVMIAGVCLMVYIAIKALSAFFEWLDTPPKRECPGCRECDPEAYDD